MINSKYLEIRYRTPSENQMDNEIGSILYDRLQSIVFDSKFVDQVGNDIPFPIVPNERCGSWYIQNIHQSTARVYFKSTDGHYGKWSFNLRRMNLGILPLIVQNKGLIIIDSTQKGKKMPDALSKTIPIWCCVLNQYIMLSYPEKNHGFDGNLYSPPSVISKSEHDQIAALIPVFVKELMNINIDLKWISTLEKPLRPIWITPESTIIEDWDNFPFYPIVCVTVSGNYSNTVFKYIKGAADDHETWGKGLTPELFWKHKDWLLQGSPNECEARLEKILLSDNFNGHSEFKEIGKTGIFVGNFFAGRQPECWDNFDAVINCSSEQFESMDTNAYLFLNIPFGKKGGNQLFKSIGKVLRFVQPFFLRKQRILLHSKYGSDRAIGLIICILLTYYPHLFPLPLSKSSVMAALLFIQTDWIKANPSRTSIKKVTTYFLSKNR